MVSSSSSVMPCSSWLLNTRDSSFFHCIKSQFTGASTMRQTRKMGAENMANRSGDSLATLLGEISPKIRTKTVITTVDRVTPPSP